jgi:hypothetical protein
MAIINGFVPTHSGTLGWVVDIGILASRTSMTTSTFFKYSASSLSALAICPGYHDILGPCDEEDEEASSMSSNSIEVLSNDERLITLFDKYVVEENNRKAFNGNSIAKI